MRALTKLKLVMALALSLGIASTAADGFAFAADKPKLPPVPHVGNGTPKPRPPLAVPKPAPLRQAPAFPGSARDPIGICKPRCEQRCEGTSCAGLNVTQCTRVRQACRMACPSRC